MGVVAEDSLSDPVGVGGRAVLGAGRGGGGTDMRWPLLIARAIENMPMCWGFEFVVATLHTLLDVLVRFEVTCRLEMTLGSVFCDREEQRLGERSGKGEGNTLFCHGGSWGTADTGVDESSYGMGRGRTEDWRDQRCADDLLSVSVEVVDIESVRGLPRSVHALSNGGRVDSGTGTPKLPAVLALPWLYTSRLASGDDASRGSFVVFARLRGGGGFKLGDMGRGGGRIE